MRLGLILLNDWELFGDGSGDYFEIQHKPLLELLDVVEQHGARLTVMAEVAQQWAHQKLSRKQSWAGEVAHGWESALREVAGRGADVQLHLHPQWLNAEYLDGKWRLDYRYWAVSSLESEVMERVFSDGKRYLEALLKPVAPLYECIAFRAGAYCIQPSVKVIENLLKAGIVCDSSVPRGLIDPDFYDYRDAHSAVLPWFVHSENIKYQNENDEGLLEIPPYSFPILDMPIIRRLALRLFYLLSFGVSIGSRDRKWLLKNNRVMVKRYPPRTRPFAQKDRGSKRFSVGNLLSKLVVRRAIQLDYDNLPPKAFVKALKMVFDEEDVQELRDKDVTIPVIAAGHVKNMHNCLNMGRILEEIDAGLQGQVTYWTLQEAVAYWLKRESRSH